VKVSVYPLKNEFDCEYHNTRSMSIEVEFTREEKKDKLFWLFLWRINSKKTAHFVLWSIMSFGKGREIVGIEKKLFESGYQRK
jgi:hypothetical protein